MKFIVVIAMFCSAINFVAGSISDTVDSASGKIAAHRAAQEQIIDGQR